MGKTGFISPCPVTAMSGLGADPEPYRGWGTQFLDYDNDGNKDVFIVNGHLQDNIHLFADGTTYAQRKQLFRNEGEGRFAEVTLQAGAALVAETVGRGAAFGDYDNDGDVDIFIVNNGPKATLVEMTAVIIIIGSQSKQSVLEVIEMESVHE